MLKEGILTDVPKGHRNCWLRTLALNPEDDCDKVNVSKKGERLKAEIEYCLDVFVGILD